MKPRMEYRKVAPGGTHLRPIETLDLRDATSVGHSTGGGEVARYTGRHGTWRVAKVVLIAATPPILLKTQARLKNAYESIKAFSETDFTADLKKTDVPA
jgi:pimeloyl-ACP methyl ester carboxylesterase